MLLNGEIDIFTNSNKDIPVSEMLTDCAPIEVKEKLYDILKPNLNMLVF